MTESQARVLNTFSRGIPHGLHSEGRFSLGTFTLRTLTTSSPLARILVDSIKNQAKINMGLIGESTQTRRKNQNLRTPSRRVATFWHKNV